jgi:uncharacterized protein YndB with AHSA1/START domain
MEKITVQTFVNSDIDKVWNTYNNPSDITKWSSGSPDWHTPRAENDLRTGGGFNHRMEAKDGSAGFDFKATYDEVVPQKRIVYTMEDGRRAEVEFEERDGGVEVKVTFDPETENTPEKQREGWQGILDNFKGYVEGNNS